MGTDDYLGEGAEVEQVEIPLVTREEFLRRPVTDYEALGDIRWAFHALGVEGLSPGDAPSPGAWALYCTIRDDEVTQKHFYSTVYPKLLPSRSQMEKGTDRAADGRKLFELIDELLCEPRDTAPVLSRSERRARELAVQTARS